MFKKRIVSNVVSTLVAVILVFCTLNAVALGANEPENASDFSLTPVYSMVLDFETAAVGSYTKAGGTGTNGKSVSDGKGLKFNLADSQVDDISAEVMNDPTGKFGGRVLKLNPFTSTIDATKRIAVLRPENLTVNGTSTSEFKVKDSSGNPLEHGYRLHYSYDFYVSSLTNGLISQDLRWRSPSADLASETLMMSTTKKINTPNTAVASATTTNGTIGWWQGSTKSQSQLPGVIHMDHIMDFETGEIWSYLNGELFSCRDFSEVPGSYFTEKYRSLSDLNNFLVQIRQKTSASDTNPATYFDNFRVDMYGSDVSASQLREMLVGNGSAITRTASADFGIASNLTNQNADGVYQKYNGTNLSLSTSTDSGSSDAALSLEDGKLKVERIQTSKPGYVNINFNKYNNCADIYTRTKDLPVLSGTDNKTMDGINAMTDSGIRYAKFAYDKNTTSEIAYAIEPVDFSDYMSFEFDITVPEETKNPVKLNAYYYQADARGSTTGTLYAGTKGALAIDFVKFDISNGQNIVKAFDVQSEAKWVAGKNYHVNYLVNLHDGTEIVYLDGVEIGREINTTIPTRGTLPRIRAWFTSSSDADAFMLDNIDFKLYNDANINFDILETNSAYSMIIDGGYIIEPCTWSVNGIEGYEKFGDGSLKVSVNASSQSGESLPLTLVLAHYNGDELCDIDFDFVSLTSEKQTLEAELDIKDSAGSKAKIMLIEDFESAVPVKSAVTLYAFDDESIEKVDFLYPGYTTKAVTFSFDDLNPGDATIIEAMEPYSLKGTFNPITSRFSKYETDYLLQTYAGHEITNHSSTHPRFNDSTTDADGKVTFNVSYEGVIAEIEKGQSDIKALYGKDSVGFVWPYTAPLARPDYDDIISYIKNNTTIKYIRPVTTTNAFTIPEDWYNWEFTCHQDKMEYFAEKLVETKNTSDLKLLSIWGHAHEMYDTYNPDQTKVRFSDLDRIFAKLSGDDIWKATNADICGYLTAVENAQVNYETGEISNNSVYDLYVLINGTKTVIPAGSN